MHEPDHNLLVVARKLSELRERPTNESTLQGMVDSSELVSAQRPRGLAGGIDSSDNLLLNIPDHPGAAIAGYSYSLVVSEPTGQVRYVQERMVERERPQLIEPLEIALVYSSPLPDAR